MIGRWPFSTVTSRLYGAVRHGAVRCHSPCWHTVELTRWISVGSAPWRFSSFRHDEQHVGIRSCVTTDLGYGGHRPWCGDDVGSDDARTSRRYVPVCAVHHVNQRAQRNSLLGRGAIFTCLPWRGRKMALERASSFPRCHADVGRSVSPIST